MYSMWEEVRDEMQKVADATKEELARAVEETKEEIQKVIRGTKDTLMGSNKWAHRGGGGVAAALCTE